MELTERKARILEFVRMHTAEFGYPPTVREIASAVGLRSTKSVKDHIDSLVASGHLCRSDRAARALSLPRSEAGLPVMGQVAAGSPILASQDITSRVELPGYDSSRHFFLRVRGDSMTPDGIGDGDLVLVRSQPFVRQSEIAVVLVGEEATVKRVEVRAGKVRLLSSNPSHRPMAFDPEADGIRVLGKVVAVLRSLEGEATSQGR